MSHRRPLGEARRVLERASEIYRTEGLGPLCGSSASYARSAALAAYRRAVRALCPRTRPYEMHGVAVPPRAWPPHVAGESYLPAYPPEHPEWWNEHAVVALHGEVTRPDDDVVVVGGGYGLTAVHAARRAPDGSVTVFEADPEQAALVRDVLALNGVAADWTVRRAAVGDVHETYGDGGPDALEVLPPGELPACDVLELDPEGSELSILEGMTVAPRRVVVETHPHKGGYEPTAALTALADAGYRVTHRRTHDDEPLDPDELRDRLRERVATGGEGLPPVVAAERA